MSRVLVSASDPGGANAIVPAARLLAQNGHELLVVMGGAARAIFASRGFEANDGDALTDTALQELLKAHPVNAALLGTSAGFSVEKRVLKILPDVPSVAVLDFWANYWQRFSSDGTKDFAYLPRVVCVMDEVAKKEMLAEGFAKESIVVTGNPYFDHFADAITCAGESRGRLLFISQPLSAAAALPGFTVLPFDEHQALRDLVEALNTLPASFTLSIRLHPKESADTFAKYVSARVSIASEATLEEAISRAGLIVGMNSPALAQAAAAGKSVLSYEPGLAGEDMLLTNRYGITTLARTKAELTEQLARYRKGEAIVGVKTFRDFWPQGATERVVSVIEQLLQ